LPGEKRPTFTSTPSEIPGNGTGLKGSMDGVRPRPAERSVDWLLEFVELEVVSPLSDELVEKEKEGESNPRGDESAVEADEGIVSGEPGKQ